MYKTDGSQSMEYISRFKIDVVSVDFGLPMIEMVATKMKTMLHHLNFESYAIRYQTF